MVRSTSKDSVDSCSIPMGSSNCGVEIKFELNFDAFCTILFIPIIRIIVQVTALLETLEFQESAQCKGHFALYNCLVLGHTNYNGVQRVYCNQYPAKPFHNSHSLDMVMIRQPGIDNGAFVVSLDTVWFASVFSIC